MFVNNSNVGDITMGSSAAVLHSNRPVAVAVAVAAALVAHAAAAKAVETASTSDAAAAEVAEADFAILCLDRLVHPHAVSLFLLPRPVPPCPLSPLLLPPLVSPAVRAVVPPSFR